MKTPAEIRLDNAQREIAAAQEELRKEREPKPVTLVVGDRCRKEEDTSTFVIVAPNMRDNTYVRLFSDSQNYKASLNALVADLRTLNGRKVDAVVPFRIVGRGNDWVVEGLEAVSSPIDKRNAQMCCEKVVARLYPLYEGKAWVMGDE